MVRTSLKPDTATQRRRLRLGGAMAQRLTRNFKLWRRPQGQRRGELAGSWRHVSVSDGWKARALSRSNIVAVRRLRSRHRADEAYKAWGQVAWRQGRSGG